MDPQADLFPDLRLPDGFVYRPDFLSPAEEAELISRVAGLPFKPFEFHGFLGRRHVVSFGWRYDFNDGRMRQVEPIPDWLEPVRDRAAASAGLTPAELPHALLTQYQPGAPIGWHRDRPQFDRVVGVSLAAPCTLRFRRKVGGKWERTSLTVAPRSAYLLAGAARSDWEHSIPPVDALRYSITFRSLRNQPA